MSSTAERGARVVLNNVRKQYGDSVAVENLCLEVEPGEFMTLLGPSGSGKTTTLNIISGFAQADSGDLLVDGQPINGIPPRKRGMGMVFQNYALFPHMTAAQNIAFPLKQRKISKSHQRELVSAALRKVRLEGFENRYPTQLSGGQQQRVALARAIVFEPRVLLMDEPLGALDRKLRDNMQLEIRRIHREVGSTVLFVTHDQEEALALSDRIAVFNHGGLEQVGTGTELYERPRTLFVAQFLGESTQLTGQASVEAGAVVFHYQGQKIRCRSSVESSLRQAVLLIRPERLRLSTDSRSVSNDQEMIAVRIVEEVYLGAGRKLTVRLPDGSLGTVRESAGAMSDVHTGMEAVMSWDPLHAALLADDNSSQTDVEEESDLSPRPAVTALAGVAGPL